VISAGIVVVPLWKVEKPSGVRERVDMIMLIFKPEIEKGREMKCSSLLSCVGQPVVVIARWDRRVLIGEVDARLHGWDPGSKDTVHSCRALVDHILIASGFVICLGAVPCRS
jgi:hypothetical protein